MNITPLERLKRLHQYSVLMTTELGALVEQLEERQTVVPSLDQAALAQFASGASAVGLDLEEIAKQIEAEPSNQGAVLEAAMSTIWGPKGVILKHLSPTIIEGGRGFIKVSKTFQQYDADVMFTDAERLLTWPAGFYRNSETREDQLMIKMLHVDGEIKCICFDSLPSNVGQMRIIVLTNKEQIRNLSLVDLSVDQFKYIEEQLDLALRNVDLHHFSPSCFINQPEVPFEANTILCNTQP